MRAIVFSRILLLCLVFFVPISQCKPNLKSLPQLETKWEEKDSPGWFFEGEDLHGGVKFHGNDIIASSWVSVLLVVCSAHYPVYWDYDNAKDIVTYMLFPAITVSTHRTSQNFSEPNTYKFYSYLRLRGNGRAVTGNYTCKSATDETLSVNRYIFWEGALRNLIYGELDDSTYRTSCTTNSCRDRPSRTVMADEKNQTIILPCSVCHPRIIVKLFKKSTTRISGYDEIKMLNSSLKFEPKLGFILNITELPSPYGVYKCTVTPTNFRNDETLIINATSEISPKALNIPGVNILDKSASYYFDKKNFNNRIVCCSNGTKPPKIYKSDCHTKFDCEKVKRELWNSEHFDRADTRFDNCRSTAINVGSTSGAFRCVGEGIDVTREYYLPNNFNEPTYFNNFDDDIVAVTPTRSSPKSTQTATAAQNQSVKIYFDEEISKLPRTEFIRMTTFPSSSPDNKVVSAYTNETILIHCIPSNYLFSFGVRFSYVMKNKTAVLMPAITKNVLSNYLDLDISDAVYIMTQFIYENEISSIICHAPLFNSYEWVNQSLDFNITKSTPPIIKGPTHETVIWKIGELDQELKCAATGLPTQILYYWMDNSNEPINFVPDQEQDEFKLSWTPKTHLTPSRSINKRVVYQNGTSKLIFDVAMEYLAGNYSCSARNVGGQAVKYFTVIVKQGDAPKNKTQLPPSTSVPRIYRPETKATTQRTTVAWKAAEKVSTSNKESQESATRLNTVLISALTIISVVLVGCGIGVACLVVKMRRQHITFGNPMYQDSSLAWNEMASSPTKYDSTEDIS